jgi:hypothetical protein
MSATGLIIILFLSDSTIGFHSLLIRLLLVQHHGFLACKCYSWLRNGFSSSTSWFSIQLSADAWSTGNKLLINHNSRHKLIMPSVTGFYSSTLTCWSLLMLLLMLVLLLLILEEKFLPTSSIFITAWLLPLSLTAATMSWRGPIRSKLANRQVLTCSYCFSLRETSLWCWSWVRVHYYFTCWCGYVSALIHLLLLWWCCFSLDWEPRRDN